MKNENLIFEYKGNIKKEAEEAQSDSAALLAP